MSEQKIKFVEPPKRLSLKKALVASVAALLVFTSVPSVDPDVQWLRDKKGWAGHIERVYHVGHREYRGFVRRDHFDANSTFPDGTLFTQFRDKNGDLQDYVYATLLTYTSGTTITLPGDFSSTNTFECVGAGGNGGTGGTGNSVGRHSGGGGGSGGGGAYAKVTNQAQSGTISCQIGAGGSGTATWVIASGTCNAGAGGNGGNGSTSSGNNGGGSAGSAGTASAGSTTFSGGAGVAGGAGSDSTGSWGGGGSGGGGAAGLNGAGSAGSAGGAGLAGSGGASGGGGKGDNNTTSAGSNGTEWDASHGSGGGGNGGAGSSASNGSSGSNGGNYGAGGGGGGGGSQSSSGSGGGGGSGAGGLIAITYTPATPLFTPNPMDGLGVGGQFFSNPLS